MAASFHANVLRGIGAGVGGYCILFPLASWLGPRLCPSCAALPTDQRGEWCANTALPPPPNPAAGTSPTLTRGVFRATGRRA